MKKKYTDIFYRFKQNKQMMCVFIIFMIVVLSLVFIVSTFHRTISMKRDILEEYNTLYKKIESSDKKISKLHESYNLNIERIYGRMIEIQEENPDEVRGAVLTKLKTDDDSIKFEASVLAILEIYDEFQSDIEIQTYLNDNVSILESIERLESVQDKYNKFLSEYNDKYLDSSASRE